MAITTPRSKVWQISRLVVLMDKAHEDMRILKYAVLMSSKFVYEVQYIFIKDALKFIGVVK